MSVRLWHFTAIQNLESIRTHGFRRRGLEGDRHPAFGLAGELYWKDFGEMRVEVTLDTDEEGLQEFRNERIDGTRRIPFFQIPSSFVEEHIAGPLCFYDISGNQAQLILEENPRRPKVEGSTLEADL
jgi:hypothetical protein